MINITVKNNFSAKEWLLTCFYGAPKHDNKLEIMGYLEDIAQRVNLNAMPWLVIGDLNIIFNSEEKQGGLPFDRQKIEPIMNLIQRAGLEDLGFTGNSFTWSNKREGSANIKQRLDRALANAEWNEEFQQASLQNLVAIGSDHGPICLTLNSSRSHLAPTFKFYDTWLKEPTCIEVIKKSWNINTYRPDEDLIANISNLGINLSNWKKDVFGKPNKKIKCLLRTIENLEAKSNTQDTKTLINKKHLELEAFYDTQEEIAKQQSRNNKIALGERNTKFFHIYALKRRKRNHIDCIQDRNNTVVSSREEVDEVLTSYFSDLFTETSTDSDEEIFSHSKSTISIEENLALTEIPTPEEIWQVVKKPKPNKASGPDGFLVSFFKHNLEVVRKQLVAVVQDFSETNN